MTTPITEHEYTTSDVLRYLEVHTSNAIDAAIEEICGVSTDHMVDVDDLPPHLETAVSILEGAKRTFQDGRARLRLKNIVAYSNGIPVSYQFRGEPITDPEGNTYRVDTVATVHPSGRIDVPIPEDQQPWWWRKEE